MDEMKNELLDSELENVSGGAWGDKPTKPAGAGLKWYHVTSTDTLTGIARKYKTTWQHLAELNKDIIKDPSKIGQHMWIRVPA
ncbi:MAG: LysM peptidoglycan-binding domain-containing protein [Clostridia bacterium]|nr:LysM peptidoglycan-binding domain-containing protein [Clostridia bacterium]